MTIEAQIAHLQTNFDPEIELADSDAGVPDHWLGYLEDDVAARKRAIVDEFTVMANYLPATSAGMMKVSHDGFLAHAPRRGLCRFLMREIDGDTYLAYSRCPTDLCATRAAPAYDLIKANGPEALRWIYAKRMDGLVDIWDFGGLLPSDRVSQFSENVADYGEMPWYARFTAENDPAKFVELLSSGGGAYFVTDLTAPAPPSGAPAFAISTKFDDMTPNDPRPFWGTLDAWTAIGLTDA